MINKKKIINKTIGEIIFPKNSPNFIQSFLKGVKILEFKIPKIKKISDMTSDQILKSPPFRTGHMEIIRNTIKKSIPKPLLIPFFHFISLSLSFNHFTPVTIK